MHDLPYIFRKMIFLRTTMCAEYWPANLKINLLAFSRKKRGWQLLGTIKLIRLWARSAESFAFLKTSWRFIHAHPTETVNLGNQCMKRQYVIHKWHELWCNAAVSKRSQRAGDFVQFTSNLCKKILTNLCWLSSACSKACPSGTPVRRICFSTWWTSTCTFCVILRLSVCMVCMHFFLNMYTLISNSGLRCYWKRQPRHDEEPWDKEVLVYTFTSLTSRGSPITSFVDVHRGRSWCVRIRVNRRQNATPTQQLWH